VEHEPYTSSYTIVGAGPGTADLWVLVDGEISDRVTLTVETAKLELTGSTGVTGPFLDAELDGEWRVPREQFSFHFDTRTSAGADLGFHHYWVSLDGELYHCEKYYCTGPSYSDGVSFDLHLGEYLVSLEDTGSGQTYTYRLNAL
jgi:hypothetical protein